MPANRFHATRGAYQLPPGTVEGGGALAVGRGIDMTDPQRPLLVPNRGGFFRPVAPAARLRGAAAADEGYEVSGDTIKDTFSLLQSDTVEKEAATLNAYFRGSYQLSSVEAALDMARSSRRSTHSVYLLLTHHGDAGPDAADHLQVPDDLHPAAEDIADDEEAFQQFRRDHGTHYIHAITYGLTIAIRGCLRSSSEDERSALGARLKAGFGAFKAEGKVDAELRKHLESEQLDLSGEVNCGGTVPERARILTGFAEIAGFLKDIADGTVRFKLGPVTLHLASYWNLLDPKRLPRCRALLDPLRHGTEFAPPPGRFGVPAGTILAWRPTPAHIEQAGDPARAVLRPPAGWALCDGQNGLPDLRGRFVRGADTLAQVGGSGGGASHGHELVLQQGTVARIAGLVTAKTSAVVGGSTAAAEHLPPYLQLVYIIKLDESR